MTSRVFSIQSSGRFGGLHIENSIVARIKNGLLGKDDIPEHLGRGFYEDNPTYGKKGRKRNSYAIIEDLSIVCVDAVAKEVFLSLDTKAIFSPLDSDIGQFFVLFPSVCTDPFDDGIEILLDGKARLRNPRLKPGCDDLPPFFSLSSGYVEAGSIIGTLEALTAVRKSKITGISFWDFSERVEIRL